MAKQIESLIPEGLNILKKSPELLIVSFLDSCLQIFLIFFWMMIALAGTIFLSAALMAAQAPNALIAVIVVSAVLGYLVLSFGISAFFQGALIGGASIAAQGKKPSFSRLVERGKASFFDLLLASVILFAASLLLFVLIMPAVLFAVMKDIPLAVAAGSFAMAVLMLGSTVIWLAFSPVYYIIVLGRFGVPDCFRKSIDFVKANLVAVLLLTFATTMLQSIIYAPFTVITGPIRWLDIAAEGVGSGIAGVLTLVFFGITLMISKTLSAIWWVLYVKDAGGFPDDELEEEDESGEVIDDVIVEV